MKYLMLIVISLGVILMRFAPFIFLKDEKLLKKHQSFLHLLPYATVSLLLVYGFKDVGNSNLLATIFGSLVCVITYLLKRNTILSILLSTVVYMFIFQII